MKIRYIVISLLMSITELIIGIYVDNSLFTHVGVLGIGFFIVALLWELTDCSYLPLSLSLSSGSTKQ